jgi:hypothetical protein
MISISSLMVPCICFQVGTTPFHDAALNGHVDAMKYLVELGAKYDEKNNVSCHTPLFERRPCMTSISSLPVPCICFQAGRTPFHVAAMKGHVDALKYMVEVGAKYDEKDDVSCYMHPCIVCVLTYRRGVVCDFHFIISCSMHLFSGWPHSFSCRCYERSCGCFEVYGRGWCQV